MGNTVEVDWKAYREKSEAMLRTLGAIPILENFCQELETIIVDCVLQAKVRDLKELSIFINSGGGKISTLIAITTALKIFGKKTTGIVLGSAFSAAFQLLQQCDVRLAAEGSFLMPHWGQASFDNNELDAMMKGETWPFDHQRSVRNQLLQVTRERTGLSINELKRIYGQDRRFTATEALKLKFVDKVVKDFDPKMFEINKK
jgi:ATP-dependent Clp protease protease subunit